MKFPLPFVPTMSYKGGNGFGADERHKVPCRTQCSMRPVRIFICFVFACLSVFSAQAQDRGAIPKTISVCELMRDPSAFNGMKIAIRGVYVRFEHGLYLRGEDCEMVRTAKGNVWPSVIWIVEDFDDIRSRGFSPEKLHAAEAQITAATARAMASHQGGTQARKVVLTYLGLFETRDGLSDPLGFGSGSAAPGQLFVDSVRDIVVTFEESSGKR